jgi:hypothetical protein
MILIVKNRVKAEASIPTSLMLKCISLAITAEAPVNSLLSRPFKSVAINKTIKTETA